MFDDPLPEAWEVQVIWHPPRPAGHAYVSATVFRSDLLVSAESVVERLQNALKDGEIERPVMARELEGANRHIAKRVEQAQSKPKEDR